MRREGDCFIAVLGGLENTNEIANHVYAPLKQTFQQNRKIPQNQKNLSLGASKGATDGRLFGAESLKLEDWPLLEPFFITLYRSQTRW
ncbi:MAG: hypothetical protein J0M26_23980, partial [Planctomycetes bacterium]|nr:hypothetical protein [Planctomycetota bacterium]